MNKTTRAADFLENMQRELATESPAAIVQAPAPKDRAVPVASRRGLKHIGGYCDADRVEKFAVLRARLGLDNSELLAKAIDDLYLKHAAKRAFGDS